MLRRKFAYYLESFLQSGEQKILLVNGARQVGKSYLIRHIGRKLFKHYVEINLREDNDGDRVFANVHTTSDLYMRLSNFTSEVLGDKQDTLVFLDEIQCYPHLFTILKFLNQDNRYTFIASGSQLGVALAQTPSVPIGSIVVKQMYPLDMEEYLWALGMGEEWISDIKEHYNREQPLDEATHNLMMKYFRYYLLTGGLPDAVNKFIEDKNIIRVRSIHKDIRELYKLDASQYDNEHKLKIRRIYDLIPSTMENKKKRVIYKHIENKVGKDYSDYSDEFEYLTASGVALDVSAISNPKFPVAESESKKLVKLYLNDVGLLTEYLYGLNVNAVLQDIKSVNLGNVYESVVAQELHAHGLRLYYYDNKKNGEVDYIIDDYASLSPLPIEVKSGKDYKVHSALDNLLQNKEYGIKKAIVLSNDPDVRTEAGVLYMPIYYCMFIDRANMADASFQTLQV